MKKLLLLTAITAGVMSLSAQTTANYKWCATYDDGAPMCNVNNVINSNDGGYFMAGTIGAGATELLWNGDNITPADGINVTYQKGFTVAKVNADGSLAWSVTSSTANVANNDIFLAATPDGGVAMACNATYGKAGAGAPTLITVCDATSTEPLTISTPNQAEGMSPYTGVVVKFDRDGSIEWYDVVQSVPYGGPEKNIYDANPMTFKSIAADEDGNVYVGGLNKTSLIYNPLVNGYLLDSANSAANAAGTALTTGSSGMILKYKPMTGHYEVNEASTAFQNNASAPYAGQESVVGLLCHGGKLYFAMTADGIADTRYLLKGIDIGLDNALAGNIVYGIINPTDMSLMSANVIESAKGNSTTHVTQFKNLQLIGDRLVMSTALNGAFIQGDKTLASSSAAKLEGATVTVSLNTLNAERGYCTGQNIGADYLAIIDETANTLYSVGYVMATGTHLHAYDLATGEYKGSTPLTSKISSISSAAFDSTAKDLLFGCYAKDLGTICGTAEAPVFSAFHGYLVAANLPDVNGTSAIATVSAGNDSDAPVEYYNLQGMRLDSPAAGTLVIRRQGSQVSKLIAR